ncbi:MAG: ATP-binding protein [Armatimonadetes bacterium]|nr:ATP-binding protein [Armatimonadota bacterium]
MPDTFKLLPEVLTHTCDPDSLGFESTADVASIEGTVGQERAVSAVDFGLGIRTYGFNMFVAGRPGTGRNSSVIASVKAKAKDEPAPSDWVYINNFQDPYRPKAIKLASGKGPELAEDMEEFIKMARTELPRAFESENYEKRKSEILDAIQRRRESLLFDLQREAAQSGFSIEATPVGIASVPLTPEGRPYTRDEYDALSDDVKQDIKARGTKLQESTNQFILRSRALEKEAQDKLQELDREIALFAAGHLLEDLREKYRICDGFGDCKAILNYLNEVENDMVERLDDFRVQENKHTQGMPAAFQEFVEPAFDRYKVNVFVTRENGSGAPVVQENNPTFNNLMGRIEFRSRLGFVSTDHTMIKSGAIHKANGGYLIVQALDLLISPFSWDGLKRVLRASEIAPENVADQYGLLSVATIRPQPIPIDIKVILIGSLYIYYLLYYMDEEFRKFFKVKADFDIEMARNDKHIAQYAAFIADRTRVLGLRPFHKSAIAKIVDYGSRLIEDKHRLSTRFIDISDMACESAYWAAQAGSDLVMEAHVAKALSEKEYRSRMIEDKVQALIEEGTIMIDVDGSKVGQANGLSIYDLGDFSFGRPSKLTARVAIGKGKIVDIQRESEMGGRIHSKGVMTLTGYIEGKFAQDKPIAAYATLAFEQLYDEVEGDSASSTELYVLLSAIGEIPIRQDIAVTGSVNQHGQIQAIGGVNRKIEGFYAVCKAKGLTGEQGVMIPRANVRHLMLQQEVVDAITNGKFNIWAIDNVDQGIAILTNMPAGEKKPDGAYPEGTVNYAVNKRLQEMAETAKKFVTPQEAEAPVSEKEAAASLEHIKKYYFENNP